jgi:hypothetical protein
VLNGQAGAAAEEEGGSQVAGWNESEDEDGSADASEEVEERSAEVEECTPSAFCPLHERRGEERRRLSGESEGAVGTAAGTAVAAVESGDAEVETGDADEGRSEDERVVEGQGYEGLEREEQERAQS